MKNMRIIKVLMLPLILAIFLVVSQIAIAADSPVRITITAQKEISKVVENKVVVTYDKAENATSGDTLVYTIVCENNGKEIIKNIEIVDPVPVGVAYIKGSATDGNKKVSEISFSIDKGKTYSIAEKLTYKMTDSKGNVIEKLATPEMYTNIKWVVGVLSPNDKVSVLFKAKVL